MRQRNQKQHPSLQRMKSCLLIRWLDSQLQGQISLGLRSHKMLRQLMPWRSRLSRPTLTQPIRHHSCTAMQMVVADCLMAPGKNSELSHFADINIKLILKN